MRLSGYMDALSLSQKALSRKALISTQSVSRALSGEKVSRNTANAILKAISDMSGKKLTLHDVEGLEVQTLRRRRKSVKQVEEAKIDKSPRRPEKQA